MRVNVQSRLPAGRAPQRSRRAVGVSLVELLVVLAVLGILAAAGVALRQRAIRNANLAAVAGEARALYTAFGRYHAATGRFPNASAKPAFDLRTLDPLRATGYYTGNVTDRLLGGQADAYDSPDDEGPNAEFWLEMTVRQQPSVRILVCRSNDAPLAGGQFLDGVFMYRNGVLAPIGE
jgi:prepilin-type N-terminal cleavage/methylation domain-containing protein